MIGFASREFKDSEPANTTGVVAVDAIVAIVNLNNPYTNMTASALKRIYSGQVASWSDFS
jgi:ABC-type phosphate transport system substrate-binding protein